MIKTIKDMGNENLCCNCGSCVGICPNDAVILEMNHDKGFYEPRIIDKNCTNCGICYEICPGYSVDFLALNKKVFHEKSNDALLGYNRTCYLGNAVDYDIRRNASSGGVITSLLLYALEKGIIDGAVVARMRKNAPLEPEPFIARTRTELIEAAKSKYCPIPSNIMLKEIMNSDINEKFAIVGLPCHIHAVRKAESSIRALKRKIPLHLGIFCSHNNTFTQTRSLISKLGINVNDISKIDYRGDGWPGRFSLLLKNNKKISLSYEEAMIFHKLWIYTLPRCLFCCDLTSELADISCGDPWIPEIMNNESLGKSIIISRTARGEQIINNAINNRYIEAREIESELVKHSCAMMRSKKKDVNARFMIHKIINKNVPKYEANLLQPDFQSYPRALLTYFNTFASLNTKSKIFCGIIELELKLISKLIKMRNNE